MNAARKAERPARHKRASGGSVAAGGRRSEPLHPRLRWAGLGRGPRTVLLVQPRLADANSPRWRAPSVGQERVDGGVRAAPCSVKAGGARWPGAAPPRDRDGKPRVRSTQHGASESRLPIAARERHRPACSPQIEHAASPLNRSQTVRVALRSGIRSHQMPSELSTKQLTLPLPG